MELIFNPCDEFQWSAEGPVSQIHSPHLLIGAPGIFSDLEMSVQMLKREWGVESNRTLLHLFMPGKTAALVPDFVVEDLPLAELQPWFLCSEGPALGQNTDDDNIGTYKKFQLNYKNDVSYLIFII